MKTIIFLTILFVHILSARASGLSCAEFYSPFSYSFRDFKNDFSASKKYSNNFNETVGNIFEILEANVGKMSAQEFTRTALYLIEKETSFGSSWGRYEEGIVKVVEKLVYLTSDKALSLDQSDAIRGAILIRLDKSWRSENEINRMLSLSKQPLGKLHNLPTAEHASPTVKALKAEIKKDLSYTRTYQSRHQILEQILQKYVTKITPSEFVEISLWLIRWNMNYHGTYAGMNGEQIVNGFEVIRLASLSVELSPKQKDEIKTEMANKPGSLREMIGTGQILVPFINFNEPWSGRAILKEFLKRPFGK